MRNRQKLRKKFQLVPKRTKLKLTDIYALEDKDGYDSEESFSHRWDQAEIEMLSGNTLTQEEFLQRIRERIASAPSKAPKS